MSDPVAPAPGAVTEPALAQLPPLKQEEQPTAVEAVAAEEELTPIKSQNGDDDEFVPEDEENVGADESEEEEEYKEESASSQGSVYGEDEPPAKPAPRVVAPPKPKRAAAVAAAAAAASASAAAAAATSPPADGAPRRKGGRPRKDPHDPKWLVSDDEDDKPVKFVPTTRPANVKAPAPTFGPNTRIVRRARFRTTTEGVSRQAKGRPRKNPNDPKWAAIDEARAKAQLLAVPLADRHAGDFAEGTPVALAPVAEQDDRFARDESEPGPSSNAFGEYDAPDTPGGSSSLRKGRPPGAKDKKPRALGTKRGRPKGSKNKPKTGDSPAPPDAVYYDDDSGSEFGLEEQPKPKKTKKGPSTDPSSPNYVQPVPSKWTRNPLASRQSTRKAALAKYEDGEEMMHAEDVPEPIAAPAEPLAQAAPVEAAPEPVAEPDAAPVHA